MGEGSTVHVHSYLCIAIRKAALPIRGQIRQMTRNSLSPTFCIPVEDLSASFSILTYKARFHYSFFNPMTPPSLDLSYSKELLNGETKEGCRKKKEQQGLSSCYSNCKCSILSEYGFHITN